MGQSDINSKNRGGKNFIDNNHKREDENNQIIVNEIVNEVSNDDDDDSSINNQVEVDVDDIGKFNIESIGDMGNIDDNINHIQNISIDQINIENIDNISNIENIKFEETENNSNIISDQQDFPTIEVIKTVQRNRKKRQFSTIEDEEMSRLEFQQWTSGFLADDLEDSNVEVSIDDVEYSFPQTTAAHFTDIVDDSNELIKKRKEREKEKEKEKGKSKLSKEIFSIKERERKIRQPKKIRKLRIDNNNNNNNNNSNKSNSNKIHNDNKIHDDNIKPNNDNKININNDIRNNYEENYENDVNVDPELANIDTNSIVNHAILNVNEIANSLINIKNEVKEEEEEEEEDNDSAESLAVEAVSRAVHQAVEAVRSSEIEDDNENIKNEIEVNERDAVEIAAAVVAADENENVNNKINDEDLEDHKHIFELLKNEDKFNNNNNNNEEENKEIENIPIVTEHGINNNKVKNKEKNPNKINNKRINKKNNNNKLVEQNEVNELNKDDNEKVNKSKNKIKINNNKKEKNKESESNNNNNNKESESEYGKEYIIRKRQLLNAVNKAKEIIKIENKGRSFNNEEIKAIDLFIKEYEIINKMTHEEFLQRIWGNERKKDKFWEILHNVIPNRTRSSLYKHVRRTYHIFEKRGIWSKEEDFKLAELCKENEGKWKFIGGEMKRMPEDCRDRWRNYVKCGSKRNINQWTVKEEIMLKNIVWKVLREEKEKIKNQQEENEKENKNKDKRKIKQVREAQVSPIINWTTISELMGGTRSRIQCRYKWKKIMKNESLIKLREMNYDTKIWMLKNIKKLGENDPNIEANLDWDALALNIPEYIILQNKDNDNDDDNDNNDTHNIRWNGVDLSTCFEKLKKTVDAKDKSFIESVNLILEALTTNSYVEKLDNII